MTLTHEPSGMWARANVTRSNFKNKQACVSMMRGKLWSLEHGAEVFSPTDAQRAIADRILRKKNAS